MGLVVCFVMGWELIFSMRRFIGELISEKDFISRRLGILPFEIWNFVLDYLV